MSARIAKKLRYFGRVQGVGFRRRAEILAAPWPVTGYVRNLPDGSVELVAEGDEASVTEFLESIRQQPRSGIERVEESPAEPFGYDSFTIRRG